MPLDEKDVLEGRGAGQKFFSPSKEIAIGSHADLEVTDINKAHGVKFPIKDKDYAYACTLVDGRVWSVNSKSIYGPLLRMGYPGDGKKFVPFKCRLTRLERKQINDPGYRVEKV